MWRFLRKPAALAAAFVFLFLPSYGLAVADDQNVFQKARYSQAAEQPGLWRIEGRGGTVWLFGTIHLLPSGFEWRTPQVEAALAQSDVIVLEAPVGGSHAQRTVAIVQRYAKVHPNQSIRALIPDHHKPRAEELSAQFGLPWTHLREMPPWLGGIMLAQSLYTSLGFSPQSGVEHTLASDPALQQKAWDFFETPEEQLGFFAKQPEDVQVNMFLSTISQMEEGHELVSDMFDAWAKGDVRRMDKLFNKNMKEQSPALFETLVVERNRNWMPKFDTMLRDGRTYFVAVGAGHLGGRHGVIALLEKRGYPVALQ